MIWSSTRSGERPFPLGVDDHLHVGEIGNRVERRPLQRPNAAGDAEDREDDDEELVARARLDDALDELRFFRRSGHGLLRRLRGKAPWLRKAAGQRVAPSFYLAAGRVPRSPTF